MSFRHSVRDAAERGIVIGVTWLVAAAIWLGTGYVVWAGVQTVRLQAQRGAEAAAWLVENNRFQRLEALLSKPEPAPSPSPSAPPKK